MIRRVHSRLRLQGPHHRAFPQNRLARSPLPSLDLLAGIRPAEGAPADPLARGEVEDPAAAPVTGHTNQRRVPPR